MYCPLITHNEDQCILNRIPLHTLHDTDLCTRVKLLTHPLLDTQGINTTFLSLEDNSVRRYVCGWLETGQLVWQTKPRSLLLINQNCKACWVEQLSNITHSFLRKCAWAPQSFAWAVSSIILLDLWLLINKGRRVPPESVDLASKWGFFEASTEASASTGKFWDVVLFLFSICCRFRATLWDCSGCRAQNARSLKLKILHVWIQCSMYL